MKITDSQIQELFLFTRQHFVEHYDLQSELVDHLANDIEAIWKEKPSLSFEQARTISFKKFGVFGFMEVVEKRTAALEKKYWKMVWGIFKEFFKLPQIVLTAATCFLFFEIFRFFPYEYTIPVVGLGCFAVLIGRLSVLGIQKKKRFKETNKKWLFEDIIYRLGNGGLLLNFIFQITLRINDLTSELVMLIYAILFTTIVLLVYIVAFILPSRIEGILIKEHPEYLFVTIH